MALDEGRKRGKGRPTPKGRQLDDAAQIEVRACLAAEPRPLRRDRLIEMLHAIQDAHGALSAPHLRALTEELGISQSEVWEVATFYHHFDPLREGDAPPPALTIRVCDGISCRMAGGDALRAALEAGVDAGAVRIQPVPCVGRCDRAPAVQVGRAPVAPAAAAAVLARAAAGDVAPPRTAHVDLAAARADGAYETLARLRAGGDWEALQADMLAAGLRGMGGAGFPAGRKWGFVRAHPGPRWLAVNADEGEPGTFKDRHLLETEPHRVLEGMLIAAWAVEAVRCVFYLRDEYPELHAMLARELAALEAAGIVGAGEVELRRGAGAYICGEESAMLESIEGRRGLPRHRPPYVAERGLFGRPTLVHNVETLWWVSRVAAEGPGAFAGGRNGRAGLRHFSVSGRVNDPGVKLADAGITLRELIAERCGGMAGGRELLAFQPGGPSAGLLPASLQDVPLDFDTLQPHGSFIGSAAIVVFSDEDDPVWAAREMLRFFEHESCGQCTPCRSGCAKAVQLMAAERWDAALLEELCDVMQDASICGLGQAAPTPIRHVLTHFRDRV